MQAVAESCLTLERLVPAQPTRASARAFGRALAVTHAAGAAAFGSGPNGWQGPGYLGRQVLSLEPETAWGTFYARQRLWPYAAAAHDRGNLSAAGLGAVERVCDRLRAGDFDDDRPPARLHGDLWAGNLIYSQKQVVLIDPAAHGGHGLTDLAMLHLFGAPELDVITGSYVEAAGLDPGWPELIGLHQLHPLLVHAVSHGAAYGQQAARVASRYT